MLRALFRDLKPELARLAGVTGFGVGDARFLERFNKATEELMLAGDFPGIVDRYAFVAYDQAITLPGDIDRIMGIAINGHPIEMRSPWYEFVQDGPGPQSGWTGLDLGLDRGETATFRDIPSGGPHTLRIYPGADERIAAVRPVITIRGYDVNGEWVRSQVGGAWIDGEQVALNGDTAPFFAETTATFSRIDSVIKPETQATVRLWAYDGSTETHLANYAPRETRPSYRRYYFPHLTAGVSRPVLARCRSRFVPVRHDDDWVIISNLPAMELMLRAIAKREADDFAAYARGRAAAIALLTEEATAYHGKARNPTIAFTAGFGLGNFPPVR